MVTRITNGKVLIGDTFLKTDLYFSGKTILGTEPIAYDNTIDAGGNFVTPGFIDLHCHGGGGADFADGDATGVKTAALTHLKHGTTALFPTVSAKDFETLEQAVCTLEKVQPAVPNLMGTHLEGPYFSPAQSGAQNTKAMKIPQPEEYDRILRKHKIVRWDYAPELDGEGNFLSALLAANVVPSAAHTDATCEQMEVAAKNGCKLITHLYSCTSTIRREGGFRIPGVTEAAYLLDDVDAELIADGCHLPHSLLRLAYKLKGPDRLALVTDAMRATDMGDSGEFEIAGMKCIIEDGVAKLPDRTAFAGSVATADRLIRTCVSAGISLADSVKMMTQTPARIMGLSHKGSLKPGYDADILIFNDNIEMQAVILQGEKVL